MISMLDLGWAAGFLEGEGYFCFKCKSTLYISCAQVEVSPINKLHSLFGGNIRHKKRTNPRWSDFYEWDISGTSAAGVMMTIYSLMSPKRKKCIETALTEWCNRPTRSDRAKERRMLSEVQVRIIRTYGGSAKFWADKFSVSPTTIFNIRNMRIYRDVV